MLRALIIAFAVLFGGSVASAQWAHEGGEADPFKGGAPQIVAAASDNGYMAGMSCTTAADAELFFVAPVQIPDAMLAQFIRKPGTFAVIIDDEARVPLVGETDVTAVGQLARLAVRDGRAVAEMAKRIARAKRRVAIAWIRGTDVLWSAVFQTGGSRAAVEKMAANCKLW